MNETSHYNQSQHNLDVKLEAIERVVETSFRAKLGDAALMMPPKFIYWDASFFNLESSTLFSRMPEADREALLFELSQNTLAEIFFLESFGMSFALKMGIVAQSLQEKLFFSLMAGEEALHLRSLMPFLARPPRLDERGFAQNIARMVDHGSREALMVLIQVVAKGWQVTTFAKLAKNCQNDALAATLRAILHDESRHHGMGLVLASADALNDNDRAGLTISIGDILMGIRQGPIALVAALSRRSPASPPVSHPANAA